MADATTNGASAPAPEPAHAPAGPAGDDANQFAGLDGNADEGVVARTEPEDVVHASPATPAAPSTPSAASPPAQTAQPAAPAAAVAPTAPVAAAPAPPAQPAAVAQPPAQTPAQAPDLTDPTQALSALQANRAEYERWLAQQHFQLTPEDEELFATEPMKFMAQSGARLLYTAQVMATSLVARMVPAMMERHMHEASSRSARSAEAERAFRTMWPQLGPEHDDLVSRIGAAVKAANPTMSAAERMRLAGQVAVAQLGLTNQPQAPVAKPRPFVPAAPGIEMGSGLPPTRDDDPWAGLNGLLD